IFEEYWYLISFSFIVLYFLILKRDELASGVVNILFISIRKNGIYHSFEENGDFIFVEIL
ncbi:hypothetical protein, partial [Streptococcus sp. 714]|uniref:hypothetical protein n=1 Tax=Streptococcus sp. 714 TaxID=2582653 RepID=UPI001966C553